MDSGNYLKILKDINAAGLAWVEAKLIHDQLDGDQKSFLAALQNAIEKAETEKISEAKLERLALAEPEYRAYVRSIAVARADMLRKRVRFDSLNNLFEAKRSEGATERAKISQGIYHSGG